MFNQFQSIKQEEYGQSQDVTLRLPIRKPYQVYVSLAVYFDFNVLKKEMESEYMGAYWKPLSNDRAKHYRYFGCTHPNCQARLKIQVHPLGYPTKPSLLLCATVYKGEIEHNHDKPGPVNSASKGRPSKIPVELKQKVNHYVQCGLKAGQVIYHIRRDGVDIPNKKQLVQYVMRSRHLYLKLR